MFDPFPTLELLPPMYKVSIIVPVYDVEHYIVRCARSLFEQTYQDLDFVFVNDCTPDRSIELLKEVVKAYPAREDSVKIISHEKNKGIAATRNTGLEQAIGEFVLYVDSDDWLASGAIELLVNKQLENDADIVSGNRLIHYEDREELLEEREYKNREQMTLQMMQHTLDHFVTGKLFRRSLFVENGLRWKEGYDVAEDRYMMTLLAYHTKIYDTVDSVVYHYERRNVNSVTYTNDGLKIIRNNKQEYGNLVFLEQFFKDKESVYQQECSRCIMEQLEYYLQASIAYSSREEFNRVVSLIDNRSDADLELIGWKKRGVRGWAKHCFGYMVLSRYKNRAIRFIKRRLTTVFSHE